MRVLGFHGNTNTTEGALLVFFFPYGFLGFPSDFLSFFFYYRLPVSDSRGSLQLVLDAFHGNSLTLPSLFSRIARRGWKSKRLGRVTWLEEIIY